LTDIIPVFSWLFLKGRCRYCGTKISIKYTIVELLTGVIYVFALYKFGLSVEFLAAVYIMSILIAVFFIDAEHKIIPNSLVAAGIIGGAVLFVYNLFNYVSFYMDRHWWNPLAGMLAGSGILLLMAFLGRLLFRTDEAMGMGDVKILAPIGLFLGWRLTILTLFLSVFAGGIISLILIILRIKKRTDTIPFGPYIVIAVLVSLFWGQYLLNWYFNIYA